MCKYCDFKSTEFDSIDFGKVIKFKLGLLGAIEARMSLSVYEGKYSLSHDLYYEPTLEDAVADVEIKYCPFCGRKLKESE